MATHANAPGKWIFWIIIALLVAAVFFFILRPEPEWVDLATAERGPMEVTIREEGKTRVKDRYQISAPVTGYLHRVQMDVGDPVSPGQLLTRIDPMPASILDARSRAEAEARAAAAASALQSIRQKVAAAQAEYDFARQEYQRLQSWLPPALSPANSCSRPKPPPPGPQPFCARQNSMKKLPNTNWPPQEPGFRFQIADKTEASRPNKWPSAHRLPEHCSTSTAKVKESSRPVKPSWRWATPVPWKW